MLRAVLLALILAFLSLAPAHGQSSGEPGATWLHLSDPERLAYAIGFRDGSTEAAYPYLLVTGRLPLVTDPERVFVGSLTPQQTAAYRRVYEDRYLAFATDTLDLGAVAAAMTRLYRDAANAGLDFAAVYRVAVMQLHGESGERVERQLMTQREAAAVRDASRETGGTPR